MRFVLLVADRLEGGRAKVAKVGRYADCVAARSVLTCRFAFRAILWAAAVAPDFPRVEEHECPGVTAARGPRRTLRETFAGVDQVATPENAGRRFAPSAN